MEKIYKVLVLDNTSLDTKDAYLKSKKYFSDRGINISYFTKKVNELVSVHEYLKREGYNWQTGEKALISYKGLDEITKDNCRKYVKEGEYDCVIFQWNTEDLNHQMLGTEVVTSFTNNIGLYNGTEFIQLAISSYNPDGYFLKISHEQIHALCKTLQRKGVPAIDEMDLTIMPDGQKIPFYLNDNPFAIDGNYAQTLSNIKPFIGELYKRQTYKWFTQAEIDKYKLVPELWAMLDQMRENASTPFIITSGLRTPHENKKAGGKPNSSHLRGLAVDLQCSDNFKRAKMLKGILPFQDEIFLEIAKRHLHIDLDSSIHTLGQCMLELGDD